MADDGVLARAAVGKSTFEVRREPGLYVRIDRRESDGKLTTFYVPSALFDDYFGRAMDKAALQVAKALRDAMKG